MECWLNLQQATHSQRGTAALNQHQLTATLASACPSLQRDQQQSMPQARDHAPSKFSGHCLMLLLILLRPRSRYTSPVRPSILHRSRCPQAGCWCPLM